VLDSCPFIAPAIPSAGVYYFTTPKGIKYEVRFGRKQSDILFVNIVFGVLNEEFGGEEYVLVNRGEIFSVMATIEAIIQDFFLKNPNIHGFQFAGEPISDKQDANVVTKRTRVYLRYAKKIFPSESWTIQMDGNKVTIERKK
jgi:hypothetical protein